MFKKTSVWVNEHQHWPKNKIKYIQISVWRN